MLKKNVKKVGSLIKKVPRKLLILEIKKVERILTNIFYNI